MTHWTRFVALAFCALPCAAAAGTGSGGAATTRFLGGRPADQRALIAVSDEWARCFSSGDVEGLLKLYAEDAVLMSPDQPRVAGIAAIRAGFTKLLQLPDRGIVVHVEEIGIDGRHAWASVLGVIRYRREDGSRREYVSRTFLVYQRETRGAWRILRDLDQPTPDAGFLKAR